MLTKGQVVISSVLSTLFKGPMINFRQSLHISGFTMYLDHSDSNGGNRKLQINPRSVMNF